MKWIREWAFGSECLYSNPAFIISDLGRYLFFGRGLFSHLRYEDDNNSISLTVPCEN